METNGICLFQRAWINESDSHETCFVLIYQHIHYTSTIQPPSLAGNVSTKQQLKVSRTPIDHTQHSDERQFNNQLSMNSCALSYCWWKKSCTSWYGKYPIIYMALYIPGDRRNSFHQQYDIVWRHEVSFTLPTTNIFAPEKWWLGD